MPASRFDDDAVSLHALQAKLRDRVEYPHLTRPTAVPAEALMPSAVTWTSGGAE